MNIQVVPGARSKLYHEQRKPSSDLAAVYVSYTRIVFRFRQYFYTTSLDELAIFSVTVMQIGLFPSASSIGIVNR